MSFQPEMLGYAAGGMVIGGIVVSLIYRSKVKGVSLAADTKLEAERGRSEEIELRLNSRERELDGIRKQTVELQQREAELKTRLDSERKSSREKEALLEKAQAKLGDTFKALSADALKANQQQFLQLAETSMKAQQAKASGDLDKRKEAVEQMVKPMADSLEKVQSRIQDLEKAREGAYASLKEQVKSMTESQFSLQKETAQLVKALRQPTGRGQWGEMQLQRVVEMAGMQEHCDFQTQTTTQTDEGKALRPDLIVMLPGGQKIVVDSKAPMGAYLDALDTQDDAEKAEFLKQHAAQVNRHIKQLSSKKYQDQFEESPEFVVLFLPSEAFFSAALSQDSELIEKGVDNGVVLATPTTLIALLRAVAYGWRQDKLAQNATEISLVGKELYTRLAKFAGDVDKMGKSLSATVNHYNTAVGSLDSRLISSARKFEQLGAAPEQTELPEPQPLEQLVRDFKSEELSADEEHVTRLEVPAEQAQPVTPVTPAAALEPMEDFATPVNMDPLEKQYGEFVAEGSGDGV